MLAAQLAGRFGPRLLQARARRRLTRKPFLDGATRRPYITLAEGSGLAVVLIVAEVAMQQFASRDLMVTSLPQDGEWAVEGECGDCTNCTDKSEKPTSQSAGDRDLPALEEQLRAART